MLEATVQRIRERLDELIALGGTDVADAGSRLTGALEDGLRVALLDLLASVAGDLTTQIDDAHVEVRVGPDPHLVVIDDAPRDRQTSSEDLTARLTLRLPPDLKERINDRADAAGISVNAWVVQALDRASDRPRRDAGGRRLRGYARS